MSERSTTAGRPTTGPQRAFIRDLKRDLRMSSHLLEVHCQARFGCAAGAIDQAQASALIDEMTEWRDAGVLPAQLQREAGQQELPGFEGLA